MKNVQKVNGGVEHPKPPHDYIAGLKDPGLTI